MLGISMKRAYNQYHTGDAQILGKREFQCNYISNVYDNYGNFLAVMSDGTIDHPNGCVAAEYAAGYCIDTFTDDYKKKIFH